MNFESNSYNNYGLNLSSFIKALNVKLPHPYLSTYVHNIMYIATKLLIKTYMYYKLTNKFFQEQMLYMYIVGMYNVTWYIASYSTLQQKSIILLFPLL